jgi:tetratricopeptide (TPR) repeat protein
METRYVSVWTRGAMLAVLGAAFAIAPLASAQRSPRSGENLDGIEKAVRELVSQPLKADPHRSPNYVEERLTDGELFYRLEDYTRAAIIFTDIVESHPNHRAYPDALFLLGDSLFLANDVVGARRRFEQILDQAPSNAAYRPYAQRALGRLIEIAIRTRSFDGVDKYFAQLSQLAPAEVEAATTYFRGKYLFSRAVSVEEVTKTRKPGEPEAAIDAALLDQAKQTFEGVQEGSPYYPQARYFIAVAYTLKREFPQAIDGFMRVLKAPATTAEHTKVGDLARLAIGRLYYELDQLDAAVQAYQSIARTSPVFDLALYELSWVFIRMSDAVRAQRTLEILAIASPDSRFLADGELLRGNLLLREGRHDEAEEVFKLVRMRFGPIQRELEDMISDHDDPVAHFRLLVRENMDDFDANAFLPERARRWSESDADLERALSVLNDLSSSRKMTEEIRDIIERLNAALGGRNKAHAFADMRRERERSIGLRNRLARARAAVLKGDPASTGNMTIDEPRAARMKLEPLLAKMPTADEDFAIRNEQLFSRYASIDTQISKLGVEILGLEARLAALTAQKPVADGTASDAAKAEIAQHRDAVVAFRKQLADLKRFAELGRLQVGVGDSRYERDERARNEYASSVERERQAMAAAGIRRSASDEMVLDRIAQLEATLSQRDAAVDAVIDERVGHIRKVVDEETVKLEGYRASLDSFVGETEEVVGGVTYATFANVRRRFYELVLRADVGRIDIAWARREEHRMRVDSLTRERSSEMQSIDDEYREIMDLNAPAEGEDAQ